MQKTPTAESRHSFWIYVAITFAIGGPLFAFYPVAPAAWQFLLLIAGSFAPTLAALITTSLAPNQGERPAWKRRLLRWRVGGQWFFFAILIPTVTCLGIYLGFNLGKGWAWLAGLLALPLIFLVNFGEEAGWRGYALPRLMRDHSTFTASLLVGLVWTLFHAPLYWNRPLEGLLLLGPILPLSVLLAWLFVSSGGSVPVCALFHASFNTWVLALASPQTTLPLLAGQVVVLAIMAIALRVCCGPSLIGVPPPEEILAI